MKVTLTTSYAAPTLARIERGDEVLGLTLTAMLGALLRGDDGDILVASGLGSTVTLSDDIAHAFRVSPTA